MLVEQQMASCFPILYITVCSDISVDHVGYRDWDSMSFSIWSDWSYSNDLFNIGFFEHLWTVRKFLFMVVSLFNLHKLVCIIIMYQVQQHSAHSCIWPGSGRDVSCSIPQWWLWLNFDCTSLRRRSSLPMCWAQVWVVLWHVSHT